MAAGVELLGVVEAGEHGADAMSDVEVRDQVVTVASLVVTDNVIRERLFVNCVIEGPAILLVGTGMAALRGCTFELDGAPPEGMLYDIPLGRACVGMVGLQGVGFEGCRLRRIGFAGTPEALAPLRAMMR